LRVPAFAGREPALLCVRVELGAGAGRAPALPVWLLRPNLQFLALFQLLWLCLFLKKGQMKFGFFLAFFWELDFSVDCLI